ncbi:helix-turn-helix domain-containing protein, partial [Deinococcus sp.]
MNHHTFTALADPHRFQIVELLRERPHSVGEIADRLGLRQPQ